MDAIGPDVDVALRRQIALLPRGVLVEPAVLQAADGGCRQPGSVLAEQRRQRLGEVAGRYPLQVKNRQQRLDRFRAAHVRRQDRRREPDAVGIGSVRLAIAHTRLADGDRTDTGHHLALRQVTVADDALVAVLGLQIGMLAEKVCNLGLYRLGEQATRPIAQDFSELILDVSWLNQLDDVIFGHGISLLRWRSGGVKHPHDMPPFRFPPSPTLGDSSTGQGHNVINLDKWNALPKHYQAAIETASRDTFTWVTGKYDYVNPPALKRLLVAGAILKPFPQEVLESCYGAANEIYADLSKTNPHFNKMYASLSAFRNESLAWNQVAELSYDSFMMRMRTRT